MYQALVWTLKVGQLTKSWSLAVWKGSAWLCGTDMTREPEDYAIPGLLQTDRIRRGPGPSHLHTVVLGTLLCEPIYQSGPSGSG